MAETAYIPRLKQQYQDVLRRELRAKKHMKIVSLAPEVL